MELSLCDLESQRKIQREKRIEKKNPIKAGGLNAALITKEARTMWKQIQYISFLFNSPAIDFLYDLKVVKPQK